MRWQEVKCRLLPIKTKTSLSRLNFKKLSEYQSFLVDIICLKILVSLEPDTCSCVQVCRAGPVRGPGQAAAEVQAAVQGGGRAGQDGDGTGRAYQKYLYQTKLIQILEIPILPTYPKSSNLLRTFVGLPHTSLPWQATQDELRGEGRTLELQTHSCITRDAWQICHENICTSIFITYENWTVPVIIYLDR